MAANTSVPGPIATERPSPGGAPTQGVSPLTFTTAGVHAVFVPAGVTRMTFALWGGGGGGSCIPGSQGAAGAAYMQFTIAVVPLEMLTIIVASGGQAGTRSSPYKYGGDGGGFTGVFRGATCLGAAAGASGCSGTLTGSGNNEISFPGGGTTGSGGGDSGGEKSGGAGSLTTPGYGAFDGNFTQTSGGPWRGGDGGGTAAAAGNRKTLVTTGGLRWGNGGRGGGGGTTGADATGGGGGGGAIFGGGGGWGNDVSSTSAGGAGGTGVCYADPAATSVTKTAGTTSPATGSAPGNTTHPNYNGTAGYGGNAVADGKDGLAVVTW